ncbi:protein kinase [Rhodococcus sp. USK10]|uniref:protein kinase domain-containing protein n=1 Tax=Rhodococcus sp. USK10 TaxID=2789739 RepID=UPI001C5D42D9|nr:protein kinase [Rhodococcus sp. USK10]QYB07399.1 protein kinase [Rhodococcus sp. USK10]
MVDPQETQRDVTSPVADELEAVGFADAVEIGHGGFGVVYRCEQVGLDRTVAVKVLTADLDEENRARFFREQRAMGRLTGHPNIVNVLQVGATDSGRPYIVMPYHPQESLDSQLRRSGPLSIFDALRLGVKTAGALETAHRLGILHRDVKPANILLTDYGEPALADFGIAHIAGGFETGTGTVTGSPAFTAPEVLRGDTPGAGSDIYSLGATLFCAITGHAAFERRSGEQVIAQFLRITTQPAPDLREHGIPDAICAVVEHAMAGDPSERPMSAASFGEELRELQSACGFPVDDMALHADARATTKREGSHAGAGERTPGSPNSDRADHSSPRSVRTAPPLRNPRGNLPLELTSFVGRRSELAEVKRLLSTTRLLTLTGLGGVGKTRLALRAATNTRRVFDDGVWLVELAELRDGSLVADVVAAELGLRDQSARPTEDVLVDFLATRKALLVLDNCEQVVAAAAQLVETLLRRCPDIRVLATSREILDISGEASFRVPPLTVPGTGHEPTLRGMPQYDAITLFADRAVAAVPDFELTEDNQSAVAEICQELDGLPLPIELAAARLRAMSVDQVRERLSGKYDVLSRGSRDAPTRQQTLRFCIDWSYELCTPAEQLVWTRLAVFAGSFELDAAEWVCREDLPATDFLDVITSLVDKSILIRETVDSVVRFRLISTLRDYGLEKLSATDDYMTLSCRHRDWYRQLASGAESDWISSRQLAWISRLNRERPNLRRAMEFSLSESAEPAMALQIATALFLFWSSGGLFNEGRYWFDRILSDQSGEPTSERIKALYADSVLAEVQGDLPAGTALVEEGHAVAAQLADPLAHALIAHAEGLSALFGGELARACTLLEDALHVFGEQAPLSLQVGASYVLGWAYGMRGDNDRAIEYFFLVRSITEPRGEVVNRSYALWAMGVAEWRREASDTAVELLSRSLQLARAVPDPLTGATCLEALAWVAGGRKPERAVTLMAAAENLVQSVGSSTVIFPDLRRHHDDCVHRSREVLGDRRYESAWKTGASMSFDSALAYALGTSAPKRSETGQEEVLTKRERQVADLVAQGMTNKEIAAQLVISQRTAQGHVEHVLAKLGFNSRAQIAAWVTERRR